jgi:hypothetical protein
MCCEDMTNAALLRTLQELSTRSRVFAMRIAAIIVFSERYDTAGDPTFAHG